MKKKFKDNGTDKGYLTEFNLSEDEFNEIASLNEISLKSLQNPKVVDVLGVSKGKGFAGVGKDITSKLRMPPTATPFHIEHQVLLANANFQEESSRVKKCQDRWEIKM